MMKKFGLLLSLIALGFLGACSKDKVKVKESMIEDVNQETEVLEMTTDPQALFLEDFKQQPDVIERPSGLLIKIIKKGTGDIPTASSFVTANYHGTLIDGTVFDTTRENGIPFSFPIDGVIDGWQEAITLMQVGAIYQIVIPAELAYGDTGAGNSIPPGATLIFEIELISVTDPLTTTASR